MTTPYAIPDLPRTPSTTEPTADLTGILKSLIAMHHLVEMFRRQLSDEASRRNAARLVNRLTKIAAEFRQLTHTP
jgi:hypothetical protein